MAAHRAPAVAGIVGSSTPVLSFGDPLRAEVATLGINPSRREFFSRDGVLLSGPMLTSQAHSSRQAQTE